MKKLIAVSGGVDSVVLLHIFRHDPDVIVAHFNHGTRPSADDDETFVRGLAKKYGLPICVGRADLGENVSEGVARISRYEYFSQKARELDATIHTAHHADDVIESIAINLIRGTGWRGLTPCRGGGVCRPFLEGSVLFRSDVYRYAAENNLEFRQDPTNTEDKYLRNRVREKLCGLGKARKLEILEIYHRVNILRGEIEDADAKIVSELDCAFGNGFLGAHNGDILRSGSGNSCHHKFSRQFFCNLDDTVAIELLRYILLSKNVSATRPQLKDFLGAIRTYAPGRKFNLPKGRFAKFTKTEFWIED